MAGMDHSRTTPITREVERPLSPHLQVYKPQLTSSMSIFHKFTGIGLAGGIVLLVAWLASLAGGAETYAAFSEILKHPISLLFLLAWTWAFFYHMMNGLRHMFWSLGKCLTLKGIYTSGAIVLASSFLATGALWAAMLGQGIVVWP